MPICAAMEATVGPEVVGSASDAEVGMSGGDFDFTSASALGRIASSIFDVEDSGVVVGVAAAFRVERERRRLRGRHARRRSNWNGVQLIDAA